jgi:hypothetical protein
VLVVQEIYTSWTKASRGGAQAAERNRTPEAMRLPLELAQADPIRVFYHQVRFLERTGFQQPHERVAVDTFVYPEYGCTTVEHSTDAVWLTYAYSTARGGAPNREPSPWMQCAHSIAQGSEPEPQLRQRRLRAPLGHWVQVRENGRFAPAWDGDWWYQKVVVNAGLFESLSEGLFTAISPLEQYSAMADLW